MYILTGLNPGLINNNSQGVAHLKHPTKKVGPFGYKAKLLRSYNAQNNHWFLLTLVSINGTRVYIIQLRSLCKRAFNKADLYNIAGEDNNVSGRDTMFNVCLTELNNDFELLFILA